ncbi:hypothetical protein CASFOL_030458 [Castilleja foliolosa]|uniref:Protein WUSCHEL n=1 Tax=Castilleja foliolosa TaxID=1961234 RepID=A0ABD3C9F1_9LAMI
MCPASSNTRWCPTPEQVMILEELYRRGLKTPNAAQIQRITAHLSLYGKIQGKNVFYWFQNHKARDRQKLRKKLLLLAKQQPQTLHQPLHYFHHHHQLQPSPNYIFQPFPQTLFHAQGCTSNGVREVEAPPAAQGLMIPIPIPIPIRREEIGSYGHDSTKIIDVGPTMFPYCTRNKPLQTLQLFPLRSSSSPATDNNNNY